MYENEEFSFTQMDVVVHNKVDENRISYGNAIVFIKSILKMECLWFSLVGLVRFSTMVWIMVEMFMFMLYVVYNTYIIGLARNHIINMRCMYEVCEEE